MGTRVFLRIPHTLQADRLLVELVDLLISIRYAHPTLVQLEFALCKGEEMCLERA
jgi:hypothetical protein